MITVALVLSLLIAVIISWFTSILYVYITIDWKPDSWMMRGLSTLFVVFSIYLTRNLVLIVQRYETYCETSGFIPSLSGIILYAAVVVGYLLFLKGTFRKEHKFDIGGDE